MLNRCQGDRRLLKLVWTNLLTNAIKYTKHRDEARVEVGWMPDDASAEAVTYYVKDDGVGFDMKYVHKLFNVFQRLHAKEDFEGTGVGLAIVQRIVLRHGGRVWPEGKVDGGATFFFFLTKGLRSMTNGTEILLIEDNAEDVEITLRAFQKYQLANKIHVVRDGEEALECLFGTGRYADRTLCSNTRLILLDLKLPKVDGFEILQRCKSDPRTKNIPVVILTSSREDRDLIESYSLGVNSYVVKPVDFTQFTEAIRQLGLYWILLNQLPPELSSERKG